MATTDTAWHLDKKVPIALMFTIFIQSATAVWWASSIESRMQAVSQSDDRQGEQIRDVETNVQSMAVTAATLTAQLTALKEALDAVRTSQRETNDMLRQLTEMGARP